jgi:arylsulfatase A-like enzyme
VDRWIHTPHSDRLFLDRAPRQVERERLGAGPAPDLLAISLSATDRIGHAYGLDSQEAAAALRDLDRRLGDLLAFLDRRVGRARLVVALTADHGSTPVPEIAAALGASECRVPGGRVDGRELARRIGALARDACGFDAAPEVGWDRNASFALAAGDWAACRASPAEAKARVAAGVAARPGVVKAWTAADFEAEPCAGACALYRASADAERSGDWVVQLDPHCLLTEEPNGAGHGSAYAYDREVPIVVRGPGVRPGNVRGPARTIDVAPTLAALAGVALAPPRDGRPLPLR